MFFFESDGSGYIATLFIGHAIDLYKVFLCVNSDGWQLIREIGPPVNCI
jgi:hypothetical protein